VCEISKIPALAKEITQALIASEILIPLQTGFGLNRGLVRAIDFGWRAMSAQRDFVLPVKFERDLKQLTLAKAAKMVQCTDIEVVVRLYEDFCAHVGVAK
jgi:hypothetical protein